MSDPIWSALAGVSLNSAARATDSVSSATSATSAASVRAESAAPTNGLGKDAFMKLLLAQMQSQDPLSPMDGQEFFAQLSQLSLIEQMYQLNDALTTAQRENQLMQAGALIGRTVEALGEDGESVTGAVSGVHMLDGDVFLDVDGSQIPLSSVMSITA